MHKRELRGKKSVSEDVRYFYECMNMREYLDKFRVRFVYHYENVSYWFKKTVVARVLECIFYNLRREIFFIVTLLRLDKLWVRLIYHYKDVSYWFKKTVVGRVLECIFYNLRRETTLIVTYLRYHWRDVLFALGFLVYLGALGCTIALIELEVKLLMLEHFPTPKVIPQGVEEDLESKFNPPVGLTMFSLVVLLTTLMRISEAWGR